MHSIILSHYSLSLSVIYLTNDIDEDLWEGLKLVILRNYIAANLNFLGNILWKSLIDKSILEEGRNSRETKFTMRCRKR